MNHRFRKNSRYFSSRKFIYFKVLNVFYFTDKKSNPWNTLLHFRKIIESKIIESPRLGVIVIQHVSKQRTLSFIYNIVNLFGRLFLNEKLKELRLRDSPHILYFSFFPSKLSIKAFSIFRLKTPFLGKLTIIEHQLKKTM